MPTASGASRYDVARTSNRRLSNVEYPRRPSGSLASHELHRPSHRPRIPGGEKAGTMEPVRLRTDNKTASSTNDRHSSHDAGSESNLLASIKENGNKNHGNSTSDAASSSPKEELEDEEEEGIPVVVPEEVIQRSVQTFLDAAYVRDKGVRAYAKFHNTIEQLHMTMHAQLAAVWRTSMQLEKPLLDAIRREHGLSREDVIPIGVSLSNEATRRLARQEEVLHALQSQLEQLRSTSVCFAAHFLTDAEKSEMGANPAYLRPNDDLTCRYEDSTRASTNTAASGRRAPVLSHEEILSTGMHSHRSSGPLGAVEADEKAALRPRVSQAHSPRHGRHHHHRGHRSAHTRPPRRPSRHRSASLPVEQREPGSRHRRGGRHTRDVGYDARRSTSHCTHGRHSDEGEKDDDDEVSVSSSRRTAHAYRRRRHRCSSCHRRDRTYVGRHRHRSPTRRTHR